MTYKIKQPKKKIKTYKEECSVCKGGWKAYTGDYDILCDKHYLEAEPTK